jgi:hypothetical protein
MPRLDPAEVGFTPEGFELDMPTRPNWQVSRSSAVANTRCGGPACEGSQ